MVRIEMNPTHIMNLISYFTFAKLVARSLGQEGFGIFRHPSVWIQNLGVTAVCSEQLRDLGQWVQVEDLSCEHGL